MKNFFKKNYVLITSVLALLLVLIGSFIIINTIKNNYKDKYKTKNASVYQYVGLQKQNIDLKISYVNDKIDSIKGNKTIYDEAILYYNNTDKVMFPFDMELVYYNQDNLSYKVNKYSIYENDLLNKKDVINAFLFDGNDLYFFTEDTSIYINNEEIILPKLSYVIASGDYLFIYNFKTDEAKEYNDVNSFVKFGDVLLDLKNDATVLNNQVKLISTDLSILKSF